MPKSHNASNPLPGNKDQVQDAANIPQCQKALVDFFKRDGLLLPPFPPFQHQSHQESTTCNSHLVRSSLEYSGDRHLYPLVGVALMRTIPDCPHLYPTLISALTSNVVLGEYMASVKIHARTSNKGGGDTFETVAGAIVDDSSYADLEAWGVTFFQPAIRACVAALVCGKRKHDEVDLDKNENEDNLPEVPTPQTEPREA
ncbi:hypothetical protein DFH09DRAFT_1089364 [Mycena vulgaris]|nr:hypothetical protein DFH09DRAFT_1089364 [Mycena vulgaris]